MNKGFTLIETLVTIVIFGAVMVGAADLLRTMFADSVSNPSALNAIDEAQGAETTFVSSVRDASYGADGSYPLQEASSTEFVFFSPWGTGSSATIDRIRYFVSDGVLYRGVTPPEGSPPSYNLADETVAPVVTSLVYSGPVFLYYDGDYAGTTTPLSQPVNVNDITYVQMELDVLPKGRQSTTTSFLGGGAIRNLKTNLGN